MTELNWLDMIEKMQELRLFSRNIIHRATKDYEIPAQHLDLLCQLITHEEGLTPMYLSKIMGVNKTIISRVIDRLNKEGYVEKTKDTVDKRSYFVSITELGKEKVDKIYTYYLSPIYELRRKLGNEDFLELMSCIQNANEKMNKTEEVNI